MARYIDAETAIEKFNEAEDDKGYLKGDPETILNSIPTADVKPAVHAHWIRRRNSKVFTPMYQCSNCGFDITVDKHPYISIGYWLFDFRYCLFCGAIMDEEMGEAVKDED